MRYLHFCETVYQNCKKILCLYVKWSSKLDDKLGVCIGRVVLNISNPAEWGTVLLSMIASFISKHPSPLALAHMAFPSHSGNQKPPPDTPKPLLLYGAVPIWSTRCSVFLRLSGIRKQTWSVNAEMLLNGQHLLYPEGPVDPLCVAPFLLPPPVLTDSFPLCFH